MKQWGTQADSQIEVGLTVIDAIYGEQEWWRWQLVFFWWHGIGIVLPNSLLHLNKRSRYLFKSNCSLPLFYSSQFVFTKVLKRTTTKRKEPISMGHKKVSMKNMKMICIFSPRKKVKRLIYNLYQFTSWIFHLKHVLVVSLVIRILLIFIFNGI